MIGLSHNYNGGRGGGGGGGGGEVLIRYETHFISNRCQNPRNICDPASSNHHNSTLLQGKKKHLTVISQLRLVGSHNTSLESVAQGASELEDLQIRKCHSFSDPCVFG